jgi:hypothetical protein
MRRDVAVPELPSALADQLARVETSHDNSFEFAPCQVTLATGQVVDHVYLAEATSYYKHWGADSSRQYLSVADVAHIAESPSRLPAPLADKLYAVGESGMGYILFTAVMSDGSRLPFISGNAVDFLDWPEGFGPRDVVDVIPDERGAARQGSGFHSAAYSWCLYSAKRPREAPLLPST